METDDRSLLRQYTERHSQDAFAALVARHVNLVYSVVLRTVRSPQLAEEVAQSAFTDLARQAHRLAPDTILSAWLYQVARRTAIDVVRHESRRQLREQVAHELTAMNATAADWTHVEPLLDEAMHALDDTDRAAVLLRYFENKSLREVGEALGTGEDAAQKRVSRAVERLREFFAKRGVAVGAGGLAIVISTNAVQAAPAGLAATISSAAALAGAAVTATLTKAVAMTTLQKTIVTAVIAVTAGAGMYEAQQASTLRREADALQQQQTSSTAQLQQLQRERDDATARQLALQRDNERLQQTLADVPNLRAEVARLRAAQEQLAQSKADTEDVNDPSNQRFLALKAQAREIGRYLEEMPDKKIPELKLLTEEDWLMAAKTANFDTDADVRKTLSRLRSLAKHHVPLGRALFAYLHVNNGQLPSDISQLKPYFKSALGETTVFGETLDDATVDAILDRYKLLHTGNVSDLPPDGYILAEKASVDKQYDTRFKFGDGSSSTIDTPVNADVDPEDASY